MSDQFRRDLQAWTEAQIAAFLRGRIGAKRKDYLAADINKLLRDRISKRLAIKKGQGIPSEFLRNNQRQITPVPPELVEWLLDHGWLTWASSHYVTYADNALANYWSGDNPVNNCGEAVEPSLGASNDYVSLLGDADRSAPEKNPWGYSGLTRLFIQAIQSAGRSWSEDFATYLPTDWGAAGSTLGCIRSAAGTYWLVHISQADGVEAAELQPAADCVCLAALANGGSLTGLDQKIADAIVLGYSTLVMVDPEAAEPEAKLVEVVAPAATQWTAVYAGSHIPLIWGWSWRYQTRGAPDEATPGAIICTHKATTVSGSYKTLHYQESVLDITFDGNGDPVGTVTQPTGRTGYFQTLDDFGPSVCVISGSTITAKFHRSWILEPTGTTPELGILASCYLPSGAVGGAEVRGRIKSVRGTTISSCTPGVIATASSSGTWSTTYPQTFINGFSRGPGYIGRTGSASTYAACNEEEDGYDFHTDHSIEYVEEIYAETLYFAAGVHGVAWNYGREGIQGYHSDLNVSAFIPGSFGCDCDALQAVRTGGCEFEPLYPDGCNPTVTETVAVVNVKTIVNGQSWDNGTGTPAYTKFADIVSDTSFAGWDWPSTSTSSADARPSWDGRGQVTGMPLPDGLSATGASITGVWVGAV